MTACSSCAEPHSPDSLQSAGDALFAPLAAAGLNLHAVFDLAALPDRLRDALQVGAQAAGADLAAFRQVLLLGHAGRCLWDAVQEAAVPGADPIDDFSRRTFERCFAEAYPGRRMQCLYPGPATLCAPLQALGEQAGWHHPSPFMVGVHPEWGSWFAYRLVALLDTRLPVTPPQSHASPCDACTARPCIAHCPAQALAGGTFNLHRCAQYRLAAGSPCAERCLARYACPVGQAHQYSLAQSSHSYSRSLRFLREFAGQAEPAV